MGDLEAQSTKSQAAQPWSYQLFTMLLLMLFAVSVLTVYVAIKSSQNAQKIDDLQNIYVDDRFKVEQDDDDDDDDIIMTTHTIRAARSVDGPGEVCESEFFPNLNITPSAHLVGSDSMNPGDNTNDGFIVAWRCNLTNRAHVIGGMKTNSAGELTVPVSGIYYIYLQLRIKVRVAKTTDKLKKLGHQIKIRSTFWNSVMERYESLNYDDNYSYETSDYYGGLHYLKKGDAITVSMKNPCPRSGSTHSCNVEVFRSRHEKSNFFGAFLVTPATVI